MLEGLLSKFSDLLPQVFKPREAFNIACRAPAPSNWSSAALIEAIKAERPDLKDATFYSPSYGRSSHTLFVGDEVFKGPTSSGDMSDFRKECRVMTSMKGQDLQAPELTTMGLKAPFYGMKRVQGVVLSEMIGQMNEPEKNTLARDIAKFAVAFGKVFEKDAPENSYLQRNSVKAVQAMDADMLRQIFGNDHEWCKKEVTDFVARIEGCKLMMMHTDLHAENILIDPVTKRMTAIIDFGMTQYRHPEMDGILVSRTFDDSINNKVWAEYVRQQSGVDIKDAACYTLCAKLAEVKDKIDYNTKNPKNAYDLRPYYQAQLQELWRAVKDAPQMAIATPTPKPAPTKGMTP